METQAKELGTTVPRIALAWLQNKPGVTSTIIGARTMEQLDDNIGALDVKLTAAHMSALDDATKPALAFPADMLHMAPGFVNGGTRVNGVSSPPFPNAPKNASERF